MNRKYTREIFLETVEKLKIARSDFTFTTDVIVGFPGESEADFQETLDVMKKVQFAKVHMFPYSERERTRAALYPHKVSSSVMTERKQRLLRTAEQMAFELRDKYVGQEMTVLLESDAESFPGHLSGLTANFLPVYVPQGKPNDLIAVKIIDNTPQGLIGKPL